MEFFMHKNSFAKSQIGAVLFFALFGMEAAFLAKDFWQEKPFTQWNENEALLLLSNSPWAKTQPIKGDYGKVFVPHQIDTSTPLAAVRIPAMNPTQGYDENTISLYIRWHSSKKIRQAIGQLGLLRKVYAEEMARQFIDQEMPDLVISISGSTMEPFSNLTFEDLQAKTFLLSKKDKNKKVPLKTFMSPKETQDGSALFLFPRQWEGNPTFDLADKEAQFVTEVGKTKIRAFFRLVSMLAGGKLDI
jgi:hypothetical protein